MIGSKPSKHFPELPLAGLELVSTCIRACVRRNHNGGAVHPLPRSLMAQLKQDLLRALFSAASHGVHQSRSLAAICQVGILLYVLYRDVMLPQIEALVSLLILPVAESSKHLLLRRTALEGLLDFCRQPGFLATTYVNCDCRIGGAGGIGDGLFKRICDVISGSAKVTDEEGVFKFHGVAVEGIRTVFDAISNIREVGDRHDRHDRHGHGHGHGHARNLSRDGSGLATARGYVDIWTPLCAGELLGDSDSSGAGAWSAASEKELMILMGSAAEQFNKHQKKGMEYCQEIKLLPTPLTARAVARFLRGCPGLSKAAIGEVLGERDQFYEEIREEFCDTFNFGGLRFDVALRLFMDAFRPPGEGQKIDRIVQSFGKKYYEQVPKSGLKSADAAYVLAFSVIMLNTDLHNTQNKRKMTLEDFGRINRNTNEGDPMPPELLSSIYAAISIDEFKISAECSAADLSHQSVFWATLAEASTKPRGRPVDDMTMFRALHEMRRDIFADAWVPALGAISAILAASPNPKTVKNATTALFVAAELGYRHKIEKVIDQVLDTLVKYTSALDYPDQASSSTTKPALAYGASIKARSSVETMFKIADLYGDSMKSGWACIVSTVMKVFAAELLTPEIILVDGESMEEAAERMPKPRPRNKGQSGSIFARAINSLISIEADGDLEYANAGGEMLRDMAKKSISSCSIESLVNDSKFLIVESLIELISALIASGKDSIAQAEAHAEGGASGAAPTDTAELALELLFSLSLRNRDRMTLFWPRIHEFLATCTRQESASIEGFAVLNKRAIEGLMRICQRLLPYKEDTADILLGSLSLVGEMHPRIVWELAPSISTELITLLSQSAPHIRTETGWRTIAILIRISASREEVLPYSLQALQLACQNPRAVSTESYIPLLETCLQLIDGFKATNPNIAAEFLECADALFAWLSFRRQRASHTAQFFRAADWQASAATPATTASATVLDLWLTSVGILTKGLCRESSEKAPPRTSIEALHRTLIGSSSLNLPPDMWVQTLRELVLPLVSDFAKAVAASARKKSLPEHIKSLQMAIDMLTSVLIKYTRTISDDNDFGAVWELTFVVLRESTTSLSSTDKATAENIREGTRTLLSSLEAEGTLCETWQDGAGKDLWVVTRTGAASMPGLGVDSLFTNGTVAAPGTASAPAGTGPLHRPRPLYRLRPLSSPLHLRQQERTNTRTWHSSNQPGRDE
jgi:brefeldin A-resistance guanine nucleotide exchange factor 1